MSNDRGSYHQLMILLLYSNKNYSTLTNHSGHSLVVLMENLIFLVLHYVIHILKIMQKSWLYNMSI